MGFSLAWFAAQGIDRDDLLERLGFTDTGEVDEYFEQDHSGGELPGGWYIVMTSDLGLLAPDKLAQWSAGGRLVAAVVHEGAMNSLATEWKEFLNQDFAAVKERMHTPLIFDGRNLFKPETMRELGFDYRAVGRP